jgi:hypothetical protein
VDDVLLILDQRRGRRPPPAPEDLRGPSSTPDP